MFQIFLFLGVLLLPSLDASGTRVRRELLDNVCDNMMAAAGNNLEIGTDLTVDTTPTSKQYFTLTASGVLKTQTDVFKKFKAVLDIDAGRAVAKGTKEDDFIKAICVVGGPVEIAFKYLLKYGKTKAKDLNEFKPILKKLWFGKYAKKNSAAIYSGFKHVQTGEVTFDGKSFSGLHNWYEFYTQQLANKIVVAKPANAAYDNTKKPPFINVPAYTVNGKPKNVGSSFYVGTSPAFDFSLFTLCFFGESPDCNCKVGGKDLKVKTVPAVGYPNMLLTAYPTQ